MFGKKKKPASPIYDVTQKTVKTWWGGTRIVPTSKAEQKEMKRTIRKNDPNAVVLDSKAKKDRELEWIDHVEEMIAFFEE